MEEVRSYSVRSCMLCHFGFRVFSLSIPNRSSPSAEILGDIKSQILTQWPQNLHRLSFSKLQLNEYETDLHFLQNFHFIHLFLKSSKPDIVLAVLQIKTKTISRSQTLQKVWIIKQTVVLLWKFWKKIWICHLLT